MLKKMLSAATVALVAAAPAHATQATAEGSAQVRAIANMEEFTVAQVQSYLDVIAQLETAGYSVDSVEKTFLGRMKITAHNRAHVRELVVSRTTGEVMRDAIIKVFADGSATADGSNAAVADEEETGTGLDASGSIGLDIGIGGGSDDDDDDRDSNGGGVSVNIGGGLSIGN